MWPMAECSGDLVMQDTETLRYPMLFASHFTEKKDRNILERAQCRAKKGDYRIGASVH